MAGEGGRFRELLRKYGKVGLGVHFSVSAASITGLYFAIKNNVDVQGLFQKVGVGAALSKGGGGGGGGESIEAQDPQTINTKERNRTAELAASSGGALALALLLNKALFPVRVPITFALTPPLARFLRTRHIFKNAL